MTMKRRLRALAPLLALTATLAAAGTTAAQEFVKVDEAARENIPAIPLVAIAYAFIWVALLGYVVVVARRIARVRGEMDELRRRLGAGGGAEGAGSGARHAEIPRR
jgi:CcmD family protein